jgi:uncharacterized membrane protein YheB (UPF0754 family)
MVYFCIYYTLYIRIYAIGNLIILRENETITGLRGFGVSNSRVDIGEKAAQLYVSIVKKKSGELLKLMNAGDIARQAVENMENEQLEKLVMSTMKTELSAIVNLGALIGLVLGLINMLIYIL